jgi:hypothetical protein
MSKYKEKMDVEIAIEKEYENLVKGILSEFPTIKEEVILQTINDYANNKDDGSMVNRENFIEMYTEKVLKESFKEGTKTVIVNQKLTDNEIQKYCDKNNLNLIMVSHVDGKTKLLVSESYSKKRILQGEIKQFQRR